MGTFKEESKVKESIRNYIKKLVEYTTRNRISIYEYYLRLGAYYRSMKSLNRPFFEKENPFLTDYDIKLLQNSEKDEMIFYFANAMNKVIEENMKEKTLRREEIKDVIEEQFQTKEQEEKLTKQDIQEVIDDELKSIKKEEKPKTRITNINEKLLSNLDGFAVVKEGKTGRINVYGFDHQKEDTLQEKKTIYNSNLTLESGYYINYVEFIESLKREYAGNKITFVNDMNEEWDFQMIVETILSVVRKKGAIRLGRVETRPTSYEEEKNVSQEEARYNGLTLRKGLYVRRDLLENIFKKLKIKLVEEPIKIYQK